MKNSLAKGRIRLICYAAIIGLFAISALVLFTVSLYQKAKYQASSVVLTGAESQLKLLDKEEKTDLVRDKIAWYEDIRDYFVDINTLKHPIVQPPRQTDNMALEKDRCK